MCQIKEVSNNERQLNRVNFRMQISGQKYEIDMYIQFIICAI